MLSSVPSDRSRQGRTHLVHDVPLVGRSHELGLIAGWIREAAAGQPRVVVLTGEIGVGKTTLIDEVLAGLRCPGAVIVSGHCDDDLGQPGLPLRSLVAELRACATPPTGSRARSWDDARSQSDPAARLADPVFEVAARRPVVVSIEDVHWADEATAAAIAGLTAALAHRSRSRGWPVFVLLTGRGGPTLVGSRLLASLEREPVTRALELPPLGELEVNRLVASWTSARPAPRLVADLCESTGGNPLLLRWALRSGLASGALTVQAGRLRCAPGTVTIPVVDPHGDLEAQLAKAQRETVELVCCAALLGDRRPIGDLVVVSGLAAAGFARGWEEALDLDILREDFDRYRFAHPVLRQLVTVLQPGPLRRRRHRAIADRLGGGPRRAADATALEIAHHLELAGPEVEPAALAAAADEASAAALRLGAWGQAARFAEVAVAAQQVGDPPASPLAQLHYRAAVGHFRNADAARAAHHFRQAIALCREQGDVQLWTTCLLWMARNAATRFEAHAGAGVGGGAAPFGNGAGAVGSGGLGSGGLDGRLLLEFLSRAWDDSGGAEAGALAELRVLLLGLLAESRFDPADEVVPGERFLHAREVAATSGDPDAWAALEFGEGVHRLGALDLDGATRCFAASAAQSERAVDRWWRPWGLGRLAFLALVQGRPARAEDLAVQAAEATEEGGSWAEASLASTCLAAASARQGRFDRADAHAIDAELMYERCDLGVIPPLLFPQLAWSRALRGDRTGAHAALDRLEPTGHRGLWRFRLAVDALAGRPDPVLRSHAARPWRLPEGRPSIEIASALVVLAEIADLVGLADLLVAAGPRLDELAAAGLANCPDWASSIPRLAAVAALRAGRIDESIERLEATVARLVADGAAVEAARARFDLARACASRGDRAGLARARALLGDAMAAFEAFGLLPCLLRARAFAAEHASELWEGGALDLPRSSWALLYSDVVDSTGLIIEAGDRAAYELLREHDRMMRACLARFGGTEFRHHGDGIAARFPGVHQAVDCALAMHDAVERLGATWLHHPLRIRVGVVAGPVTVSEHDVHGLTVVRAVRVCGDAGPGELLVSAEVASSLASLPGGDAARQPAARVDLEPLGPRVLKGFRAPEPLFRARRRR